MGKERIVTVFGSSRPHEGNADYEEALSLGRALAERGFKSAKVNPWIDSEVRAKTWQERLFELIRMGDGFVACKGGTGTLVELAVVWEMLNKSVIRGKPFAVLGDFWQPILDRVREVELGHPAPWGEANGRLVYIAASAQDAAQHLKERLK